jgi:hypothetical protein
MRIILALLLMTWSASAQVISTNAASASVSVAFNAPTNAPSAGNLNYKIWWTTNFNLCYSNQVVNVGTNLAFQLSSLPVNSTLYFFVTWQDTNNGAVGSLAMPTTTNSVTVSASPQLPYNLTISK